MKKALCILVAYYPPGYNPTPKDGTEVKITNDRTMVPVRAISEAFGSTVNWNNETKTVEIISN